MRTGSLLFVAALAAQAQNYIDPGMKKVVQIAIVCKDVEACTKRWAAVVGAEMPKISLTRPGHEVKVLYNGKPSEGQAKLSFFNLGQVVLEVIQPVGGPTSWKDGLDQNGESIHHIAFQVQDLEKTIQSFEQQGMGVVHRGRYDKDNGSYVYLDTKKQLGVTVELLHSDTAAARVP
jgi:catechol 2,3-dioxygenase-like lactoylglutathione lyase family enzyme